MAPGTTPCASRTVPEMLPRVSCAAMPSGTRTPSKPSQNVRPIQSSVANSETAISQCPERRRTLTPDPVPHNGKKCIGERLRRATAPTSQTAESWLRTQGIELGVDVQHVERGRVLGRRALQLGERLARLAQRAAKDGHVVRIDVLRSPQYLEPLQDRARIPATTQHRLTRAFQSAQPRHVGRDDRCHLVGGQRLVESAAHLKRLRIVHANHLQIRVQLDTLTPERCAGFEVALPARSEEHTSELQSQSNLVCRLLLE